MTSAGITPLLLSSPLTFTWMQTCSGACPGGRCADSRSAIFSLSTVTQSNCSATTRVLLAWRGADQMPGQLAAQRAQGFDFLEGLPACSSRQSGAGRLERGLHAGRRVELAHGQQQQRRPDTRPATGVPSVAVTRLESCPLRMSRVGVCPAHESRSWTSPNSSHFPSRTRPPTCTCRPACRR